MQRFGPYALTGLLGKGGMGSVYQALEPGTGRPLALKVLNRVDPKRLARFEREAQLAAGLDHPGIVKVHACGAIEGIPYIACEMIDGRPFNEVYGQVDRRQRLAWIRDAARALGYAHEKGVVHRDVKGPNLLVDREGRIRVVDFGLASAKDLERLTRTGQMVGTPSHMAPEQFDRRRGLGPGCDVWGLGVELYLALTGSLPFDSESPIALGAKICQGDCAPPRSLDPTITADEQAVALMALEPELERRYADGNALADDLDRLLGGERPLAASARRPLPWKRMGIGAALLALIGAPLAYALRPVERPDPAVVAQAPPSDAEPEPEPKPAPKPAEPAPGLGFEDAVAGVPGLEDVPQETFDFARESIGDVTPIIAYHQGRKLVNAGRYEEGRPYLERGAEGGVPKAQFMLASEVLLASEPQACAEWARRSSELGYAPSHQLYADCLRLGWGVPQGTPQEVFRHYEQALSSSKVTGEVSGELGRLCLARGDYEEAVAWFEKGHKDAKAGDVLCLVDLARAAAEQGDEETLLRAVRKVRKEVEKVSGKSGVRALQTRLSLAELQIRGVGVPQDIDGGLKVFDDSAAYVEPRDLYRLSLALEAVGRLEEAARYLDQAADPSRRPFCVDALAAKRGRGAK